VGLGVWVGIELAVEEGSGVCVGAEAVIPATKVSTADVCMAASFTGVIVGSEITFAPQALKPRTIRSITMWNNRFFECIDFFLILWIAWKYRPIMQEKIIHEFAP
jgi:hypothetical protein